MTIGKKEVRILRSSHESWGKDADAARCSVSGEGHCGVSVPGSDNVGESRGGLKRPDIGWHGCDVGKSPIRSLEEELLTVGGRHTAGVFGTGAPQVVSQLKDVESVLNFCEVRMIPVDTKGAVLKTFQQVRVTLVQEGVLTVVITPEVGE